MEDLVTIIVPVYNTEKYVEKCLESIVNQTYQKLEVILVDDGSTDKSKEICIRYKEKDDRIKLIEQKHGGVGKARNTALENVKGKYVYFLDSDDYLENDCIEKLLAKLKETNSDIVICGYNRVYNEKIEKFIVQKNETLNNLELLKRILEVQGGFGYCCGKLWKIETIKDIKFNTDLKIAEDALFCMETCKNMEKIYIMNEALYNYKFNENSAVRKYDENFVDDILKSMKVAKNYLEKEYKGNEKIINKLNNYIAYHILLITVNYCFNDKNGLNFIEQIERLKTICNIEEFKIAIKKSDYEGLSITRKITLFTLKYKLYFITMLIGKIRQAQFKK